MRRTILLAFLSVAGMALAAAADTRPVLLELFTSEGCSDCPPADKLLETLDRTQPVPGADLVVLSEHVDYWNRLGWSDPWSSAAFSKRQQEYAAHFGIADIYTPQLVIDGRAAIVGSDAAQADAEIRKASRHPAIPVALSAVTHTGGQIRLHVAAGPSSAGKATVYVAIADDHVQSNVARGENAGRALHHVAVLRNLVPVGSIAPGRPFDADTTVPGGSGSTKDIRVIVFLQDQVSGHVLGVAQQRP